MTTRAAAKQVIKPTQPFFESSNKKQKTEDKKRDFVPLCQRMDRRWNMWIELNEQVTVESIIERITGATKYFDFVHVSGPERGCVRLERPVNGRWVSIDPIDHVHIIAIKKHEQAQWQAPNDFTNWELRPTTYAMPIKEDDSLVGLFVLHKSNATKTTDTITAFQFGEDPLDDINNPTQVKHLVNSVKRHGTQDDREKYAAYFDQHIKNELDKIPPTVITALKRQ